MLDFIAQLLYNKSMEVVNTTNTTIERGNEL